MSAERSNSPSICVIGSGRWGKNHIRTLSELGHLGGIADLDADRRRAMAEAYPQAKIFDSVDGAEAAGFDGFVVATPAHTHYEVASYLLGRGNHVLVEKPITLFAEQARELCKLAASKGSKLMVGHVLLFHPAIARMRELIAGGKIGKLQYIYSNRLNLGTVRTEENILWSFAPHDVSIFHFLIGSSPTAVESRGGVFLQPEIHDTTMTLLRYPDNVVGHIFLSWLHPYKEHRLVVVGSKGMLSFEDSSEDKELLFYEKGIDWVKGEPKKREGATESIDYQRKQPLTEELRYFIDCIARDQPIEVAGGESGVEVLEVLETATADMLGSERPVQGIQPEPAAASIHPGARIHPTAIVDDGVQVGDGARIWHFTHVQSNAVIGEGTSLGQNVYVGGSVKIGRKVKIQNNVSVYEGVELEDYVFCGPSMVFTNVLDPRSKYPRSGSADYSKTLVREGASLGANCTIVCGTTIGRHAFVAAGAVVTGDVPDYALMMGVPARRAGWMCECGERLPEAAEPTCPRCSRDYIDRDGILAERS